MTTKSEVIAYGGWARNLRLANDKVEVIITLDVGPRVLSLAPVHNGTVGENVFCVFPEHSGGAYEGEWMSRGGHRLWLAPENEEAHPYTYNPDNAPVQCDELGEGHFRFVPPAEPNGAQKEIEIALHPNQARAVVTHRVSNRAKATLEPLAPWALSVMAAGGVALVPQPPLGQHPRDLLPNRSLVLWPYTDLTDPRLYLGRAYFTLAQSGQGKAFKIGIGQAPAWAGYWRGGVLFIKQWPFEAQAAYPDLGSTCELFTNDAMLEVETLAPLVSLAPGQSTEHVEEWQLFTEVPAFDPRDDDSIATALKTVGL